MDEWIDGPERLEASMQEPRVKSLFPSEVLSVVASPDMYEGWLYPAEEACIRKAVIKRRREFTAGRVAARLALSRLGFGEFPLLMGPGREPLWPEGVVGSLSHCDGFCGVVVARRGPVLGLGLDVEQSEPLTSDLAPLVCTPWELERVSELPATAAVNWKKVIFSAKESVHKCVYPLIEKILDFPDVQIEIFPQEAAFSVEPVGERAAPLRGLGRLHGRFDYNRAHVFTGVTHTSGDFI